MCTYFIIVFSLFPSLRVFSPSWGGIYTDGYKDEVRTAAAVVAPNSVKTIRLRDNASIFTAELRALDMAFA